MQELYPKKISEYILTASEIGFNLERQVAMQEQRGTYQRPVYKELAGSEGGGGSDYNYFHLGLLQIGDFKLQLSDSLMNHIIYTDVCHNGVFCPCCGVALRMLPTNKRDKERPRQLQLRREEG